VIKTASVSWRHDLAFSGRHHGSPELNLRPAEAEAGEYSPLHLVLVGLAGCTGMDVISILSKKQQQVTAFSVHVEADQAEDYPKVFTNIKVMYRVAGHAIADEAVKRSIELSVTKYCPVNAMLGQVVDIEYDYEIEPATDG